MPRGEGSAVDSGCQDKCKGVRLGDVIGHPSHTGDEQRLETVDIFVARLAGHCTAHDQCTGYSFERKRGAGIASADRAFCNDVGHCHYCDECHLDSDGFMGQCLGVCMKTSDPRMLHKQRMAAAAQEARSRRAEEGMETDAGHGQSQARVGRGRGGGDEGKRAHRAGSGHEEL
jgi:hypothetical protein